MSEKVKHIAQIFSSKVVAFLVGIVRGFFVPGYLGPNMYGVIQLLGLVKTVMGFTDMGFNQAYMRLMPSIKIKTNSEIEKKELQNTVFSFLLISSVLGMVITALIPFFIKQNDPELQSLMVFCFSITAVTHFFTLFGSFFFQTQYIEKNFPLISKLNILHSLLSFALIMSTVFFWKIYGVFLAELITVIVIQGIYFYKTKIHLHFQIHWRKFKEIFKFSFPFFLSNVGFHFVRLTDRTVITIFLTLQDLGLYGFALNLSNQLRMVSVSINEVVTPYFLDEIAATNNFYNISGKIKSHSLLIASVNSLIILPLLFFLPMISLILKEYTDSIPVLKLLLINAHAITMTLLQKLIISSAKLRKQNLINISMYTAGLANVIISISFIKMGYGIVGVAVATLLSNSLMTVMIFMFSHKYYLNSKNMFFYLKLFAPIILFTVFIKFDILSDISTVNKCLIFFTNTTILITLYWASYKKVALSVWGEIRD